jgi:hypothetical protein
MAAESGGILASTMMPGGADIELWRALLHMTVEWEVKQPGRNVQVVSSYRAT